MGNRFDDSVQWFNRKMDRALDEWSQPIRRPRKTESILSMAFRELTTLPKKKERR